MVLTRDNMYQTPEEPVPASDENPIEDLSDLSLAQARAKQDPPSIEDRLLMAEKMIIILHREVLMLKLAQISTVPQVIDPEQEFDTVNGPVKVKDIPLGPDGRPEEEWAVQNCLCPTHEARRKELTELAQGNATGQGMYL